MFTGLIQDLGTVRQAEGTHPRRLEIATALPAASFALGESIALSGVCLTVVSRAEGRFAVEAGAETLARTTLGSWSAGSRVHLERALAIGERLGGHFVLGHVDGVGQVRTSRAEQGGWLLEIAAPEAVEPYLLPKGSVAVDGVSLTLNEVRGPIFSVFLIPETLRRTVLPTLQVGAGVNLEADILGKYVARLLGKGQGAAGVTREALEAAGFA